MVRNLGGLPPGASDISVSPYCCSSYQSPVLKSWVLSRSSSQHEEMGHRQPSISIESLEQLPPWLWVSWAQPSSPWTCENTFPCFFPSTVVFCDPSMSHGSIPRGSYRLPVSQGCGFSLGLWVSLEKALASLNYWLLLVGFRLNTDHWRMTFKIRKCHQILSCDEYIAGLKWENTPSQQDPKSLCPSF